MDVETRPEKPPVIVDKGRSVFWPDYPYAAADRFPWSLMSRDGDRLCFVDCAESLEEITATLEWHCRIQGIEARLWDEFANSHCKGRNVPNELRIYHKGRLHES